MKNLAIGLVSAMSAIMLSAIGVVAYYCKSEVVSSKMIEVELVSIASPPKHFYVNIRDLSTGVEYKNVYVSQHFNGYRELTYNWPFVVTKIERRYVNQDNKIVTEFDELRSGLEWTKQFRHHKSQHIFKN